MKKFVAILSLLLLAMAEQANASMVYVNSSSVTIGAIDYTHVSSKYRMSNNNWDMSLAGRTGTSPGGTFLQSNLGNVSALNGVEWSFSVEYKVGQGFTYTLTRPNTEQKLVWRNDAANNTPSGDNTQQLIDQSNIWRTADSRVFNILELRAQNTMLGNTGSSLEFKDFSFSGASISGNGFSDGTLGDNAGASSQYVVSTVSFTTFDWTLSGKIIGNKGNSTGSEEGLKFELWGRQGQIDVVPEPASALIFATGLVGFGFFRQRRNDC